VTGGIDLWIRRFHQGPAEAPRLLCFPHAGGAASFFVPLSKRLSAVAQVGAVQYPGRQERRGETPATAIGPLADAVAAVLDPLLDRPVAFFGHSMGAVVAFEVIRRLEGRGAAAPFMLFASGRNAPSTEHGERVHQGGDAAILAKIRSLGGTDPRVLADPELVELILPPTRADYRAIETYSCPPEATVASAVTVLLGDRDTATSLPEAARWREHTTGAFALEVFPGGHFYLVEQQAEVAAVVAAGLTAASRV